MASIASKVMISSVLILLSSPSIAFLASLIVIKSIGKIIGKLNTAINVALFSAFEAMPATSVRTEANPIAANRMQIKYSPTSATGFPITNA